MLGAAAPSRTALSPGAAHIAALFNPDMGVVRIMAAGMIGVGRKRT